MAQVGVKGEAAIAAHYKAICDIVEATIEDGLLTVFVPNFKKQEKKRVSLL
jgi:HSP20 family molecular chaperone IbpA